MTDKPRTVAASEAAETTNRNGADGLPRAMLEAELSAHLGYERYAPEGRNSGNSRNGKRTRSLRTSAGDTTISVPRDRNGTFQSPLLEPYQASTNELEDRIISLYAKGMSARDIRTPVLRLCWRIACPSLRSLRCLATAPRQSQQRSTPMPWMRTKQRLSLASLLGLGKRKTGCYYPQRNPHALACTPKRA